MSSSLKQLPYFCLVLLHCQKTFTPHTSLIPVKTLWLFSLKTSNVCYSCLADKEMKRGFKCSKSHSWLVAEMGPELKFPNSQPFLWATTSIAANIWLPYIILDPNPSQSQVTCSAAQYSNSSPNWVSFQKQYVLSITKATVIYINMKNFLVVRVTFLVLEVRGQIWKCDLIFFNLEGFKLWQMVILFFIWWVHSFTMHYICLQISQLPLKKCSKL